jgi:hypothetical protein
LKTDRWESVIGSVKVEGVECAIALIDAPWTGGIEIRLQKEPTKKLFLDDAQVKYEFDKEKK